MERTYEDVTDYVKELKKFDLRSAVESQDEYRESRRHNVERTRAFLRRVGISQDDVDKLSFIHVTGTKGKGSTCAFTENILRTHGYKTGFFSSPHLVEYRERVRIGGKPLPRDQFARQFFQVYDQLATTGEQITIEPEMPFTFQFFLLLALKIFIEQHVDVVILEVGIGGEYDCTNLISNPVACGITTLDYDHVDILGTTLASIAWHKAGIMKEGTATFTLPQTQEGLDSLAKRAVEKKCPLYVVPELSTYNWGGRETKLGIEGEIQKWNASLALQLSSAWIKHQRGAVPDLPPSMPVDFIPVADVFIVPFQARLGIKNCVWPARHQVIPRDHVTYYLDGAHTGKSIECCADWFCSRSRAERETINGNVAQVLIFNVAGDRPERTLLEPLVDIDFDAAAFCPNIVDQQKCSLNLEEADDALERSFYYRAVWHDMRQQRQVSAADDDDKETSEVLKCVLDALSWACVSRDVQLNNYSFDFPDFASKLENTDHIQILVTGSMKLAGCALKILDPYMNDR